MADAKRLDGQLSLLTSGDGGILFLPGDERTAIKKNKNQSVLSTGVDGSTMETDIFNIEVI